MSELELKPCPSCGISYGYHLASCAALTAGVNDGPPCTVCGKQESEHGSYPTCATHPYSPDGKCGHVGTYARGTFVGVPCAGADCKNGCVAAHGVQASAPASGESSLRDLSRLSEEMGEEL